MPLLLLFYTSLITFELISDVQRILRSVENCEKKPTSTIEFHVFFQSTSLKRVTQYAGKTASAVARDSDYPYFLPTFSYSFVSYHDENHFTITTSSSADYPLRYKDVENNENERFCSA